MKKSLSKLPYLIIGLALATTVSYLKAGTWSNPTSQIVNGTPNGNTDTPLNVGSQPQDKNSSLITVGFKSLGPAIVASSPSDSSYTLLNGLTFGVNGNIGAKQYCDETGQNCSSSMGGGSSVPAGTVAAFNLTTCPAGWIPADGNGGTKDLRGSFIRGYGTSTAGTAASGGFGLFQDDEFKSHRHYISSMRSQNIGGGGSNNIWDVDSGATYTNYEGGTETRPDNVALLFCQKDGTSAGGGSGANNDEFYELKAANNISTFPNNVVCKNGNNSIILRIEDVWGDSNPAQVVYKAQQDQYFLGYRKDNGQLTSTSGYNIGICPSQLSLDGRLTQL